MARIPIESIFFIDLVNKVNNSLIYYGLDIKESSEKQGIFELKPKPVENFIMFVDMKNKALVTRDSFTSPGIVETHHLILFQKNLCEFWNSFFFMFTIYHVSSVLNHASFRNVVEKKLFKRGSEWYCRAISNVQGLKIPTWELSDRDSWICLDEILLNYFRGKSSVGLEQKLVARSFKACWKDFCELINLRPDLLTQDVEVFLVQTYLSFAEKDFLFLAQKSFELFRASIEVYPFIEYVGKVGKKNHRIIAVNELASILGDSHSIGKNPYLYVGALEWSDHIKSLVASMIMAQTDRSHLRKLYAFSKTFCWSSSKPSWERLHFRITSFNKDFLGSCRIWLKSFSLSFLVFRLATLIIPAIFVCFLEKRFFYLDLLGHNDLLFILMVLPLTVGWFLAFLFFRMSHNGKTFWNLALFYGFLALPYITTHLTRLRQVRLEYIEKFWSQNELIYFIPYFGTFALFFALFFILKSIATFATSMFYSYLRRMYYYYIHKDRITPS